MNDHCENYAHATREIDRGGQEACVRRQVECEDKRHRADCLLIRRGREREKEKEGEGGEGTHMSDR